MVHYELLWWGWAPIQLQLNTDLGASAGNGQDFLALEWATGGVRICCAGLQSALSPDVSVQRCASVSLLTAREDDRS